MDCESCKYRKVGKKFPNMYPCRKGHSAFFTCCVDAECRDYEKKETHDDVRTDHPEDSGQPVVRDP